MRIFKYHIPTIPDCSHHRLVTLTGGNVHEHIFHAGEQLLRMVANFEEEQLTLVYRFLFEPSSELGLQERLRIELAMKIGDNISADTVKQMIDSGPLSEFYEFKPHTKSEKKYNLPYSYPAVCEIIRQEEKIKPHITKELNPKIPSMYYSLYPFETQEDNDYLMLDTLLSRIKEPCAVEMLVRPVDHTSDLDAHYKYIMRLISINRYFYDQDDDKLSLNLVGDSIDREQVILKQKSKRDPIADEILREQEEVHCTLRQTQLLFHIKTFANQPEQALMLASVVAESGISGGKYRIISYSEKNGADQENLLKRSINDSQNMNVSVHAMNPKIWNSNIRKGFKRMERLCRLATVDELKGLMRLPVGGYGSPRCIRKTTDPKPEKLQGKIRLFFKKPVSVNLKKDIKFKTKDGRITLKPSKKNKKIQIDKKNKVSNSYTYDLDVEATNANIQESIAEHQIRIVENGPKELLKVDNPTRLGGTLLIGYDLESTIPSDHAMNLNNLSKEFREGVSKNLELHLPLANVPKHIFISGVPGSGKSVDIINLLVQFFQHGIPFIVIEPVKTEYRILKTLKNHEDPSIRDLASKIRIYTPGNDQISPFKFNPLTYPEGITLDEHIGQVLSCFESAMPMGGPLQALIAEAVEEVYKNCEQGEFPRMRDLVDAAWRILEDKNYVGEIRSNLQAAIEVRLGLLTRRSMGRIFNCQQSVPSVNELLEYPTIIEMDYLTQENACLLTLFILSAIREDIRIDEKRQLQSLHHVTVIEEAHNIVGRTGEAKASEEIADPKAFAAQYVSRMLAELRALGEGIIIADQLPSAVAPEVVKNTGTKIAHRLVSNDDRENLGGAMLLGGTETEEIARLSPGEAYFYTEGLYRPRKVQCLNASDYLQLGEFPNRNAILHFMEEEEWYITGRKNCAIQTLLDIRYKMDSISKFIAEKAAIIGRPSGFYPAQVEEAYSMKSPDKTIQELKQIQEILEDIAIQLRKKYDSFLNEVYNPQTSLVLSEKNIWEEVDALGINNEKLFDETVSEPYSELISCIKQAVKDIKSKIINLKEKRRKEKT